MEIKNFIQEALSFVRYQCDTITQELSDDQFNWTPPGTANPMSAILIHLVGAEDDFIQAVLRHQLPIWEKQDWSRRIAVATYPMPGHGWKEFSNDHVKLASVMAYEKVVRETADTYIASLAAQDFDRGVKLFGQDKTVGQVLSTMIVHSAGHVGEMAVVKGIQGSVGLPY